MKDSIKTSVSLLAGLLVLVAGVGCGGGGGGGSDDPVQLTGKATYPDGLASDSGPADTARVQVLDLERNTADVIAEGETDAEGNYTVVVPPTKAVAVVVAGTVRVSGLINAESGASKDFDGITDVACEAGVSAVVEGAINGADLSAERIANLEAAAALVVAEGGVNYDDPASVSAAAARVRMLTNDGLNPPGTEQSEPMMEEATEEEVVSEDPSTEMGEGDTGSEGDMPDQPA